MLITGQNKVSNLSRPFPLPTASCRLFLLQQMFQIFVISDAFQLFCNLQIFLCLFLEKLNMPQNTPVTKAS